MREQVDELNYPIVLFFSLFYIASEKPASHGAYSTGQCRDSAEPSVRQITSESLLPPGNIVTTTLGCSFNFWSNIVNMEWSRGKPYFQK